MQEHEYKARDKTVQKMSRDGLREENLRSKKEKRITRREADEKKTAGHREQELDFGNGSTSVCGGQLYDFPNTGSAGADGRLVRIPDVFI